MNEDIVDRVAREFEASVSKARSDAEAFGVPETALDEVALAIVRRAAFVRQMSFYAPMSAGWDKNSERVAAQEEILCKYGMV